MPAKKAGDMGSIPDGTPIPRVHMYVKVDK